MEHFVCWCAGVTEADVRRLVRGGVRTFAGLRAACGATGGCGGCAESIRHIATDEIERLRHAPAPHLALDTERRL